MALQIMCTFIFVISLIEIINSAPIEDLIDHIPHYNGHTVNFKAYSGYLNATTGRLFYLFLESAGSPSTDPLVLWLNGGPGCSSLFGSFIENGPWHPFRAHPYSGVHIEYNPYSWNSMANMLYIESPPCVGFSYPYSMDCSTYYTDDNTTKHDNLEALYSFFDKFPEFGNHSFYITGESYVGHFGPQLAALIVDENQNADKRQNSSFSSN